jgi:hypothetical protein
VDGGVPARRVPNRGRNVFDGERPDETSAVDVSGQHPCRYAAGPGRDANRTQAQSASCNDTECAAQSSEVELGALLLLDCLAVSAVSAVGTVRFSTQPITW